MTPCMPCSFGLLPYPRSGPCTLPNGAPGVTVTVRYVPLVTAACGTRVARTVRTTMLACGAMAPSLAGERGPSPGYHRVVGKSLEGLRQRVRDSNSGHRKVPAWWRPLVLLAPEEVLVGGGLLCWRQVVAEGGGSAGDHGHPLQVVGEDPQPGPGAGATEPA
jgi:hypothetical protein